MAEYYKGHSLEELLYVSQALPSLIRRRRKE
jgi:hypothetical protein